jgi:hypothetical protein
MGNRAVVCFDEFNDNAIGIYLHWNGGRDSIEGFLLAARTIMDGRMPDEQYARARLIQVMTTFFPGNLSIGVARCCELDCNNGDNGLYVVSSETLEIVGRHYAREDEQLEYEPQDIADQILKGLTASSEAQGE